MDPTVPSMFGRTVTEAGLAVALVGVIVALVYILLRQQTKQSDRILDIAIKQNDAFVAALNKHTEALNEHTRTAQEFHNQVTEAHKYQREEHIEQRDVHVSTINVLKNIEESQKEVVKTLARINGYKKE